MNDTQDLSTITPNVTGLVLADPKRKVTDHPIPRPSISPKFDPFIYTVLAIDLGISYTSASYFKDGKFHYVTDESGRALHPSYISFVNTTNNFNNDTTQILYGQDAKTQLLTNPENTIFNWQRLLRHRFGDPVVQSEIHRGHVSYKIVSSVPSPSPASFTDSKHEPPPPPHDTEKNQHFLGLAMIEITNALGQKQLYRPEEMTTLLVSWIKHLAEAQSGSVFSYAVVTMPSDYNDDQISVFQEAIGDTGLDSEYLEVVVVEMDDGVYDRLSSVIERRSATIRFDDEWMNRPVVEFLVDQHLRQGVKSVESGALWRWTLQHVMRQRKTVPDSNDSLSRRVAILNDLTAMKRLQNEVRKANSIFTSTTPSPLLLSPNSQNLVRIEIESFFNGQDFSQELSLSQWQDIRQAALETTLLDTVEQAFETAPVNQSQIDVVIVTGASPLVPDTVRLLKQHFHGQNVEFPTFTDPALAALHGVIAIATPFGTSLDLGPCGEYENTLLNYLMD
ncbi:ATPase with role in protein import into the ER [Linnemannia exigua]|uniref:ATPase with role in protein import into the ER n=1 Tax=Linnemannia exigua TaxID=604196 RepID=A0AAD4H3V9_9FUNG|nr:ATPase with role in protein import into the ER [Linnemannia exigua]